MTAYDAVARRDGRFWFVEIPALGGATQARRLNEVEDMARDYAAEVTGEPEAQIEIRAKIVLDQEVVQHLNAADQARREADAARSLAARELRQAARVMREQGMTVREVGKALNVSFQRAAQLLAG